MKNISAKKRKLLISVLCILIVFFAVFLILKIPIIKEITFIILIAFVLAYTLKPIQNLLMRKGLNCKTSALILILGLILGLVIILTILVPSVIKEIPSIKDSAKYMEEYFEQIYLKLKPQGNNKIIYTVFNDVNRKITTVLLQLFTKIVQVGMEFSENILAYLVIPIIVYYFLCDNIYLKNRFLMIFPLSSREILRKISKDVDKVLGRYIITQFILSVFISAVTFIVLISLKVKFPIILSVLNGLFNIIPYFGPIFGGIPCIVVAFLTSSKTAIYTAIWLYMIQLVEGNIISPKVIGESVSMHPVTVIIILLIGEKLGGFLGMVLAVPISVIIKVIYEDLNYYLF